MFGHDDSSGVLDPARALSSDCSGQRLLEMQVPVRRGLSTNVRSNEYWFREAAAAASPVAVQKIGTVTQTMHRRSTEARRNA
jgi:hypothetical protein